MEKETFAYKCGSFIASLALYITVAWHYKCFPKATGFFSKTLKMEISLEKLKMAK